MRLIPPLPFLMKVGAFCGLDVPRWGEPLYPRRVNLRHALWRVVGVAKCVGHMIERETQQKPWSVMAYLKIRPKVCAPTLALCVSPALLSSTERAEIQSGFIFMKLRVV